MHKCARCCRSMAKSIRIFGTQRARTRNIRVTFPVGRSDFQVRFFYVMHGAVADRTQRSPWKFDGSERLQESSGLCADGAIPRFPTKKVSRQHKGEREG